ncbi:MAG: 50S ribosomal protein L3 [Vampirovibrionales bacterium]|nr:50S ribosomal protein L3 [Vampirovibrionales bacterium]
MSLKAVIGKKRGMTQIFDADGMAVPVTVVELLPLTVTQLKTQDKEGYSAVQVGFEEAKAKHLTKAEQQHLQKNNLPLLRRLKEFRVDAEAIAALNIGDILEPVAETSFLSQEAIEKGLKVAVTGLSIGKGFQGNTKRWNHHRGPMSHGSKSHRLPGSIGAGTTPGRVFKGLRMAGNMGAEQVTVSNLKVVGVLPEKRVVLIRGSVPGVEGGTLVIQPKRAKWNS